ncbi:MAG: SMI1/KNR4 family protein [Planctomycetota bacterium]
MSNNWGKIIDFYSRNGIFTCVEPWHVAGTREIEVCNLLFKRASQRKMARLEDQLGLSLTPSHRAFFSVSNGGIFLSQRGRMSNGPRITIGTVVNRSSPWFKERIRHRSGFCLYSVESLAEEHKEVVRMLRNICKSFRRVKESEKERCLRWLDGLIVIGEELNSGNYLAIDYNRSPAGEEYPIIFLGHEIPFSCSVLNRDDPIIAKSVDELLLRSIKDPVRFLTRVLGSTVRYCDGTADSGWYPESYRKCKREHKVKAIDLFGGSGGEEVRSIELEEQIAFSLSNILKPSLEVMDSSSFKRPLPDEVIREELLWFWKTCSDGGANSGDEEHVTRASEAKIITFFCEKLIEDYEETFKQEYQRVFLEACLLTRLLNKELLKENRNYVSILVLIDGLLGCVAIPVGCNSWPLLACLGAKLYESVVANLIGFEILAQKAAEGGKNLFDRI